MQICSGARRLTVVSSPSRSTRILLRRHIGLWPIPVSAHYCHESTDLLIRPAGNPNLDGFPSATFTVKTGANKLTRPVAGGKVAAGILKASPSVLPSGVA